MGTAFQVITVIGVVVGTLTGILTLIKTSIDLMKQFAKDRPVKIVPPTDKIVPPSELRLPAPPSFFLNRVLPQLVGLVLMAAAILAVAYQMYYPNYEKPFPIMGHSMSGIREIKPLVVWPSWIAFLVGYWLWSMGQKK